MAHLKRTCAETSPVDVKRPKLDVLKRSVALGVELISVTTFFQHWVLIIGDSAYEVWIGPVLNKPVILVIALFRSEKSPDEEIEERRMEEMVQKVEDIDCIPMAVIGPKGVVAKNPASSIPDDTRARSPSECGSVRRRKPGGRKDLGFETEKTDPEIDAFITKWVKDNPNYHLFGCGGKNCQHFVCDMVHWLSDGECTLPAQFEDWPTDRSEKMEIIKTLRHADKNGFPTDGHPSPMSGGGFTWNYQMTSLELQFEKLAEHTKLALTLASAPPSPERMLKLYGLYKQFWEEDVKGARPSVLNPMNLENRKKWDAWAQFKGWTRTQCLEGYTAESSKLQRDFLQDQPHLWFEP